jgi:hypothetical protein
MSEANAKALTAAQILIKKAASLIHDGAEKLQSTPWYGQLETIEKDVQYIAEKLGADAAQEAAKP